jgi:hypothetical protein
LGGGERQRPTHLALARDDRDRRADLHPVGAFGTRILAIVPSSTASNSIVALSVSISARMSPDLTVVAFLDQPFGERALLHRRRQSGHLEFDRHGGARRSLGHRLVIGAHLHHGRRRRRGFGDHHASAAATIALSVAVAISPTIAVAIGGMRRRHVADPDAASAAIAAGAAVMAVDTHDPVAVMASVRAVVRPIVVAIIAAS